MVQMKALLNSLLFITAQLKFQVCQFMCYKGKFGFLSPSYVASLRYATN